MIAVPELAVGAQATFSERQSKGGICITGEAAAKSTGLTQFDQIESSGAHSL